MLNWLTKGSKSSLPEPTALQTLRAKQIEQLRYSDSSVSEIQRDVEYRVLIKDTLMLYIYLPPHFPQDKPVFKLVPPASHPWVDDNMLVTGCYSLNTFVVHSNLGKVVKEVVEEFRRNPPVLLPTSSTASTSSNHRPSSTVQRPLQSYSQPFSSSTIQSEENIGAASDVSDTSSLMPELKDLTVDEMKSLLADDDKLQQLLASRVDEVNDVQQKVVLFLEKFASENIARKTLLDEKKSVVLKKYEQLNDLQVQFESSLQRQDDLHAKFDLNLTADNLKVAALQAEEHAEAIAEQFLSGQITVEEFNEKYMAARKLCHLRRAKEDKLSQNIRQHSRTF